MHLVVAVVAGNVARQHARIRGVRIAADHRQSHPGNGPHAEALEHHHMAVPAADEDDIAQDGLVGITHQEWELDGVARAGPLRA